MRMIIIIIGLAGLVLMYYTPRWMTLLSGDDIIV